MALKTVSVWEQIYFGVMRKLAYAALVSITNQPPVQSRRGHFDLTDASIRQMHVARREDAFKGNPVVSNAKRLAYIKRT